MSLELTIVMPCLNEAETLERCIKKAQSFLDRSGIVGEIVIGDNGSTDGSIEIARRCGARVVKIPIRGYGAALYGAVSSASGKYCVMGDSDDSYDFSRLDGFVRALRAGADLVMGNRFLGGIEFWGYAVEEPIYRKPHSFRRRPASFSRPGKGFSLWPSGVLARRVCAHGFADDRDGVRLRNGD